jgi:hypothetical protein
MGHIPVISELGRLRQVDCVLVANFGYMERLCLKSSNNNNNKTKLTEGFINICYFNVFQFIILF